MVCSGQGSALLGGHIFVLYTQQREMGPGSSKVLDWNWEEAKGLDSDAKSTGARHELARCSFNLCILLPSLHRERPPVALHRETSTPHLPFATLLDLRLFNTHSHSLLRPGALGLHLSPTLDSVVRHP